MDGFCPTYQAEACLRRNSWRTESQQTTCDSSALELMSVRERKFYLRLIEDEFDKLLELRA